MLRFAGKQRVSVTSASRKPQQKKANAVGTHTGRPSYRQDADATNVPKRSEIPYGYKRLKSGLACIPIGDKSPPGDSTDDESSGEDTLSTNDDSDANIEMTTNILEPSLAVRNQRHETNVLLDIKDVPSRTEDEAFPLGSNQNSPDFLLEHNGEIIKVRDATRLPEQTRKGRQGKVTYAIGGKHLLHPTCGIRNAVNCKVNVCAIHVRTRESAQCGGVTISPGMLARVETSSRWLLIQAITAYAYGDSRYFHYHQITILM